MNRIRKAMIVLIISIPVLLSNSFADNDDLPIPICKSIEKPNVVINMVK